MCYEAPIGRPLDCLNIFAKRSGSWTLKKRSRKEKRNVFSQRVNPWKHEMREVVQAKKTSGFKAKFDREEKGRREVMFSVPQSTL